MVLLCEEMVEVACYIRVFFSLGIDSNGVVLFETMCICVWSLGGSGMQMFGLLLVEAFVVFIVLILEY